jgi:hypothetical protein
MQKNDFIEMIKKTNFDEATKQLFMTSYCIGYDQGKVESIKELVEKIQINLENI